MKILICPLNWGLGHAGRDGALINQLLDRGHEVVIAGSGPALDLLKSDFPELEKFRLPSLLKLRYSRRMPAWTRIMMIAPGLLLSILVEHFHIRKLIRQVRPEVLISDNRYGIWSRHTLSILITHQLVLRMPPNLDWLERPVHRMIRRMLRVFDRVWIPDFPGENSLSGELSHKYPLPAHALFIGPLSRMTRTSASVGFKTRPGSIDLLVILSGPEPQRTQLQQIVLKQVLGISRRVVILQGLPGKMKRTDLTSSCTMYTHLQAAEIRILMRDCRMVICRSGYTTILDLYTLRKKALIIPTPGQTEQEYLAGSLSRKGMFLQASQDELDLEEAMADLEAFQPDFGGPAPSFFSNHLEEMESWPSRSNS